jgi:hypothetical protein
MHKLAVPAVYSCIACMRSEEQEQTCACVCVMYLCVCHVFICVCRKARNEKKSTFNHKACCACSMFMYACLRTKEREQMCVFVSCMHVCM